MIFDKQALMHFQRRAHKQRKLGDDFLLQWSLQELRERLQTVNRHFEQAVYWGYGDKALISLLQESGKVGEKIQKAVMSSSSSFAAESAQLFVSLYGLYPQNNMPQLLHDIARSLTPDGLFLGVIIGENSLAELKTSLLQAEEEIYNGVSPRVYPFLSLHDMGKFLQEAGFALPVVDTETVTVYYQDLYHLMRDLRVMGMQNALHTRSRRPVSRRFFARANEIYQQNFAIESGKIPATFCFLWMSAWRPSPHTVSTIKPGQAKKSLAQALKEIEQDL